MNTVKSLLNQLCGSKSDTRKDIEARLKNCFADPLYISNSEMLPENDSLKADARICADAFEAVTNGMCNDDIISSLNDIPAESFFLNWRYLTEAIYHIYCGNKSKAETLLNKIEENTIPGLLIPVLSVLSGIRNTDFEESLSPAEQQFIREIAREKKRHVETIEKIKLDLDKGREESFTDNTTLLITDFYEKDPESAKSITLWVLRQFLENEMSPELFLDNIILVFGEAEAFRLCALSFTDNNPELGLFFWIKALLSLLRGSYADMTTADIYLEIIDGILLKTKKSEDISNLLYILEKELAVQHPQLIESYPLLKSGLKSHVKKDKQVLKSEKPGISDLSPVQFELFS